MDDNAKNLLSKIVTVFLMTSVFILVIMISLNKFLSKNNIEDILIENEEIYNLILDENNNLYSSISNKNIPNDVYEELKQSESIKYFYKQLLMDNIDYYAGKIEKREFNKEELKLIINNIVTKYELINQEDILNNLDEDINIFVDDQKEIYENKELNTIVSIIFSVASNKLIIIVFILITIFTILLFYLNKNGVLITIGMSLLIPMFILYLITNFVKIEKYDKILLVFYRIIIDNIVIVSTIGIIFIMIHMVNNLMMPIYKKIKYKYYGIDIY